MTPAQRRTNAPWLRAQIESLRWTATMREIPQAELVRMLAAIADGADFRAAPTEVSR